MSDFYDDGGEFSGDDGSDFQVDFPNDSQFDTWTDEFGNTYDQDGNPVYATDENGNPVDAYGNPVVTGEEQNQLDAQQRSGGASGGGGSSSGGASPGSSPARQQGQPRPPQFPVPPPFRPPQPRQTPRSSTTFFTVGDRGYPGTGDQLTPMYRTNQRGLYDYGGAGNMTTGQQGSAGSQRRNSSQVANTLAGMSPMMIAFGAAIAALLFLRD